MNLEFWKTGRRNKEKSEPAKAAMWFIVCGFLQKGFSTITTPVYTRLMTTEEYGQFSVYSSIYGILIVIVSFNISGVLITRGLNKFSNNQSRFIFNAQIVALITTLIFGGIYLLNQQRFDNLFGLSEGIMCLMFLQMLTTPAYDIWSSRERYHYKYKKIIVFTIISLMLNAFIGIGAVYLSSNKGIARIVSNGIIQSVLCGIILIYNLSKNEKKCDRKMIKYIFAFNFPLIFQGLANQILGRSDILMIKWFEGDSQAGIYNLGYGMGLVISIFTVSINNSYVPWLYQSIDERKIKEINQYTNIIVMSIIVIISIVCLITPEIICFFAPDSYYQAAYVVPPVAVGIAFMFIYTLFVNIELYYDKTRLVMFGSVLVALINIILNLIFIPQYGFVAAAYTTMISYLGYVLIHFLGAKRCCKGQLKLQNIYNLRFICLSIFVQLFIMIVSVMLYDYIWIRMLLIGLILVIGGTFLAKSAVLRGNHENCR